MSEIDSVSVLLTLCDREGDTDAVKSMLKDFVLVGLWVADGGGDTVTDRVSEPVLYQLLDRDACETDRDTDGEPLTDRLLSVELECERDGVDVRETLIDFDGTDRDDDSGIVNDGVARDLVSEIEREPLSGGVRDSDVVIVSLVETEGEKVNVLPPVAVPLGDLTVRVTVSAVIGVRVRESLRV